jgi:hypothetical protein
MYEQVARADTGLTLDAPANPAPASRQGAGGDPAGGWGDIGKLAAALLRGLVTMALISKRRQADLAAAMLRTGIKARPEQVEAAIAHLRNEGLIDTLVPMYDGGLLVSVTSYGMETATRMARRANSGWGR